MTIPVLIEPMEGTGFRATGGESFALTAEGSTRDGALARLRELIEARMAAGAEIVSLEVASPDNPWLPLAGWLKDKPLLEPWKEAPAEYRRSIEEDDSRLGIFSKFQQRILVGWVEPVGEPHPIRLDRKDNAP